MNCITFNRSLKLGPVVAETTKGQNKNKTNKSLPMFCHMLSAGALLRASALGALVAVGIPAQAADGGDSGGNRTKCLNSGSYDDYIGACGGATEDGTASGGDITLVDNHGSTLIVGGYAEEGSADHNRVTILSGQSTGTQIYGGYTSGDGQSASYNTIEMTGGDLLAFTSLYGGASHGTGNNGTVEGNSVTMTGGTAESTRILGGYASSDASVSSNTVSIGDTANLQDSYVYGGQASGNGDVTSNRIIITGNAQVTDNYLYAGSTSGQGRVTDNRIVIEGQPTLTGTYLIGSGGGDTNSNIGNTLEIHSKGLTARQALGFQEYHFILPADTQNNDTILTLGNQTNENEMRVMDVPSATDLRGARVGVALQGGGSTLHTGDQVILIHNGDGVETDETIARANMTAYQGVSLQYSFDVSADENNLYATVASDGHGGSDDSGGPTVLEQTKAPVEGRANTMALATQAGDLVSGEGMARALSATEGANGSATFGATAGGTSRYNSGSHIDASGLSIMVGTAKRFPAATGQWMAGVFFEGGYGSYDTYNSIAGQATVRGSGHSRYFGGGALLHRSWADADQAGLYAEGSARLGRISSDWDSSTMLGTGDASYDTATMYYGTHAGVGYILPLNEKTSIDAHVKGFWTHQDSDSVTIAGDPYEFEAMDSFRSRLGLRLNRAVTEQVIAYLGSAWEHEFDGKARATTYGLDTPSPSLKGDTGVFELGFDMKPRAEGPLTVGLGVQGYTGKREGISGTARLMWAF